MKVVIHDSDENRNIRIVLPTGLLFNPVTAMLAQPFLSKALSANPPQKDTGSVSEQPDTEESAKEPSEAAPQISRHDLIRFCNEINRMKRLHKNMPLVDVEEDGGGMVKIYL
ncbi:MAG: hypothetical protein ACI4V1_00420 [Eubacteriales bacterium]